LPVNAVLPYGTAATPGTGGLALVNSPSNDAVSITSLTCAGAHVVLFTTGRGTPLGAPVPTLKIATNTALAERKRAWIDFNAGSLADGTDSPDHLSGELFSQILEIASGRQQTKNEQNGYREIAIWKEGVTV
jgi:altronate hydrolase